jgi:hypothetical protein
MVRKSQNVPVDTPKFEDLLCEENKEGDAMMLAFVAVWVTL